MTRQLMVAGNWKMNGTQAYTKEFFAGLDALPDTAAELLICPAFTSLQVAVDEAKKLSQSLAIGAQTMAGADNGAYTGQVSAEMLLEMDIKHVILGHSERRQYQEESNAAIAEQVAQALKNNMIPIACVGETFNEREAAITDKVVTSQVEESLANVPKETNPSQLVVAYEPVWAIGTGKTCDAAEANRVCGLIRKTIAGMFSDNFANGVRILYGGSVKPANAEELFGQSDIDGGLVGGASLKAADYIGLVEAANNVAAQPAMCGV